MPGSHRSSQWSQSDRVGVSRGLGTEGGESYGSENGMTENGMWSWWTTEGALWCGNKVCMPVLPVGGTSVCLEMEAVTPLPCQRAAGKAVSGYNRGGKRSQGITMGLRLRGDVTLLSTTTTHSPNLGLEHGQVFRGLQLSPWDEDQKKKKDTCLALPHSAIPSQLHF